VQKGKKKAKKTSKLEFDFSGDTREGERPWDFSWALQNTLEKNYDVLIPLSLSRRVCVCVRARASCVVSCRVRRVRR
jgi:hypothetical protein